MCAVVVDGYMRRQSIEIDDHKMKEEPDKTKKAYMHIVHTNNFLPLLSLFVFLKKNTFH